MIIGQNIIKYRKKRELSQEDLAEKVGVSRQAVSKWERGESVPSTENLVVVAEALDITIEELTTNKSIFIKPGKKRIGMMIGYSLSGVAAAFFYGFSTVDNPLKISYVILGMIGATILSFYTHISYSGKVRTKILRTNLIYLVIINIIGLFTKYYGGVIAFILILLAIFLYEKFLKKNLIA